MVKMINIFVDGMLNMFTFPDVLGDHRINVDEEYDIKLYGDEMSDSERLYGDWKVIGMDMISAMQQYEQKYKPFS